MSFYYIMSKSNKSSSDTNTSSTHSETMVPLDRRGRTAATATNTDMEALFADLAQSPGETKTPSFEEAIFKTPDDSEEYSEYMKTKKGKKTSGKKTRKRSGQKNRPHPYRSSSSSSSQPAPNPIFEGDVAGPSLTGTMSSSEPTASPLLSVDDDWATHGPEHTYDMGLTVTPGRHPDDKTVTQDKTNDGKKEGGRKSKKRKSRRRKTHKHKKKHRKRKRKTKRKTKHKKHKKKRKTKRR